MEKTVDNIIDEYKKRLPELNGQGINTIYFGGGTPSCLPVELLERICHILPMDDAVENTIEVNPEDVTVEKACAWSDMGFNRVSMGIQSLEDAELSIIGRRHTSTDALNAISALQNAGIKNISCDLIYGLPGQTLYSWQKSLDMLLSCRIQHVSAYSLTYEPRTRLSSMLATGKIKALSDEEVSDMYSILCGRMKLADFIHYEISNFALPGFRSIHNSSYWTSTPYLGLGPAAHSFDDYGVRRVNPSNIDEWLKNGTQIEYETPTERLNDVIVTAFRTMEGLDMSTLATQEKSGIKARALKHIRTGNIIVSGERLAIPEEKWIISDSIICDLMAD